MPGRPALGARLGEGKEAEVFAWADGRVAKLYRSGRPPQVAFREAAKTSEVAGAGLPCPRVWGVEQIGERGAVIMDRVEGPTLAAAMQAAPARTSVLVSLLVDLQQRFHAMGGLALPSVAGRLERDIGRAGQLSAPEQNLLLQRLREMPDGRALCHMDFHPMNVVLAGDGAVALDWADAALGHPAADICRSYLLLRFHLPDLAEGYLALSTSGSGVDRDSVLAWQPLIAAARLAENVAPAEEQALRRLMDGAL